MADAPKARTLPLIKLTKSTNFDMLYIVAFIH